MTYVGLYGDCRDSCMFYEISGVDACRDCGDLEEAYEEKRKNELKHTLESCTER